MISSDYKDILSAFEDWGVEYLVVGAHAMAFHGVARSTGDIDLWVKCDADNSVKVYGAMTDFGAPLEDTHKTYFDTPGNVFQIGVAPNRIDILTAIDGVVFSEAYESREKIEIDGLIVPVINRHHLIMNKQAVGRPQDLVDIELLKKTE